MDDQRVGKIVRALRRRRGWRQTDLASAAGCSQNLISLVERGHLDRLSVRTVRRIAMVLEASLDLEIRWRGAALDRMLDEDHARLVAFVAEHLRSLGWLVEIEVTYSEYGERGSFDLLAFHPACGVVLAIEVKTDIPSAEATVRKLDEKSRLAMRIARARFNWQTAAAARLLVINDSPTQRARVGRHQPLFDAAFPARNVAIRRWLRQPGGADPGFVSIRDHRGGKSALPARERIRVPKTPFSNPGVAG
ncbi:MAG TPA: helix-turn-helix domain-containing protein [Candidatus Limnocylindrales bacterium]